MARTQRQALSPPGNHVTHLVSARPVFVERERYGQAVSRVPVGLLAGAWVLVMVAGVSILVMGMFIAGIALCVLALGVAWVAVRLGRPERIVKSLPLRLIDSTTDARLVNITEGLSVAAGIDVPELYVLDDPACNAIAFVMGGRSAVVFTSGLLDTLDRIELEGVIAHELVVIRRGDARLAAIAGLECAIMARIFERTGRIMARLIGPERTVFCDQAAVRLTRYPPGLGAALAKLSVAETRPSGLETYVARITAAQWLAPLAEAYGSVVRSGMLDLNHRVSALAEL